MLPLRCSIKSLLGFLCVLVLLWVLISMVEVPKAVPSRGNDLNSIESRIERLQEQMNEQIRETNMLLARVKEYVNKETDEAKEVEKSEERIEVPAITQPVLPILVISCDRVTVARCLDNLIKFRPNKETFPIIVSQDCGHNETYRVIKTFVNADPTISVIRQPDLSEIPLPKAKVKFRGYYKIARHYKWALRQVFVEMGYDAVVIVEDDLDISPDFFEYFLGTYPLLIKDPTIWCISAWNDNGKKGLIDLSRPELLHRTDFFPGLGWMMRKEMWKRLEPIWPPAFFDDWLRNPNNTEGRACIRPEISRTYSFGKVGVSKGLFFDKHLKFIQLNEDYVEFTKLDLSYLIKETYDKNLESVYSLPILDPDKIRSSAGEAARVTYSSAATFSRAAHRLHAMDDFRSGIPRTAYRGIVTLFVSGVRVYITPEFEWTKYDPSWG